MPLQRTFPNCVQAIDKKHVTIQAPANSSSQFLSYRGSFSIALLAVEDARYHFRMTDVEVYGKSSDRGTLLHQTLAKHSFMMPSTSH